MSAILTNIQIANFRSCVDTELQFSPYTALVGYNNSGKSNVLTAIQWLLRRTSLGIPDFFNLSSSVTVTGTFSGITEDVLNSLQAIHRSKIQQYVRDESISIRRTQAIPDAKSSEIPLSVLEHSTKNWVPNPAGIDNAINALFPDPIRIGAMENATEDASKSKSTTTIGKLLSQFLTPIRTAHEADLNNHLLEIAKRISADGEQRLPELGNIDSSINNKIADLFPDISIKLDFAPPTFDEIIKSGTVKVYENDNAGRNFASYGHGAQRSIQMALIRHLAEIKQGGTSTNTTMLLIDEPELYLHPFAIEHIRDALKTLSASGYQVIFSTHSAQMIPSHDAANTILIRKNSAQGTHSRRRLTDAVRRVVADHTHQVEHLFSLTNSSQLLFAEHVVLAEGKTEHRLLPKLFALETSKTLPQCKIALISQDGADNTKKSREILTAMDLPSKAIVDLDYAFKGAHQQGYLSTNDPDIQAIKTFIPSLAAAHGFAVDSNTNLPKKNGLFTAAEAYEIIAAEPAALAPINNLH